MFLNPKLLIAMNEREEYAYCVFIIGLFVIALFFLMFC